MFEQKVLPKIGLYSTGLKEYWSQFSGLHQRLTNYGKFIEKKMSNWGIVYNFGMVEDEISGKKAGEYFANNNVDIIFCHAATYCNSASILPIHQRCHAKVVILNLQPSIEVNYENTTIEEWLAQCNACPVPEYCNALSRANIQCDVVSGLLGLKNTSDISLSNEQTEERPEAIRAWKEIKEWISAAAVKRTLSEATIGFLGNTYNGMLDLYSDYTMIQAQIGVGIKILEMDDLDLEFNNLTKKEIDAIMSKINSVFKISNEATAEKLVKKPTIADLTWSAKVAASQFKLVKNNCLSGLTYYYHGDNNSHLQQLQSGCIVGNSLLTATHVPCAGEGDLKTNIAMKICDILNIGGSFCEIVCADYNRGTILLGHDGPFHLDIADGKPILRCLSVYHGKKGSGISVEAKVKQGLITTVGLTQTSIGKLKLIVSEGESTNGPIMKIGNTQTHVKFDSDPDQYFERWFAQNPTHHCAMSIGHNTNLLKKVGKLLNIEVVEV